MNDIKKIMVAVDFSDYALPSVQYAAGLANKVGAELLLVNVYNQRDLDALKTIAIAHPNFTHETYIEQNISNRQKQLEEIAQEAGCEKMGIKTHTLVSTGVPYLELLHAIESQKPDLLVMGTKGRSNLVDTIAGSCAQKMFRRSPIPLLSIRGKEQS